MTAIIGGTGSGKSTLVNLDPALLRRGKREHPRGRRGHPGDGAGSPARQARIRSPEGGAVQRHHREQHPLRQGGRATDEEVAHAAETAQALEFILAMPEGFQSVIAQGGTNLSGGQKQRLAIARALVRKPEIYIFDDTFSALDFKTDAKLRAALRQETADATVIIVAQRVNTVMDADRIIVLDDGGVVGHGHAPGADPHVRGLPRDRLLAALRGGAGMSDGRGNPQRPAGAPAGPRRRTPPGFGRPGGHGGHRGGPMGGFGAPVEKAKNFGTSLKRLVGYLRPRMTRAGRRSSCSPSAAPCSPSSRPRSWGRPRRRSSKGSMAKMRARPGRGDRFRLHRPDRRPSDRAVRR